jgi:hypothetical protein
MFCAITVGCNGGRYGATMRPHKSTAAGAEPDDHLHLLAGNSRWQIEPARRQAVIAARRSLYNDRSTSQPADEQRNPHGSGHWIASERDQFFTNRRSAILLV